jgi:hypothetical protein
MTKPRPRIDRLPHLPMGALRWLLGRRPYYRKDGTLAHSSIIRFDRRSAQPFCGHTSEPCGPRWSRRLGPRRVRSLAVGLPGALFCLGPPQTAQARPLANSRPIGRPEFRRHPLPFLL